MTAPHQPGRLSAGLSVKELINEMQGWPREKYKEIIDNPRESGSRIAAARVWYHATSPDMSTSGMPIAGGDLDRIFDRTEGKPTQAVEIVARVTHSMQDAMKRILANPEAFEAAKAMASRITPISGDSENDSSGN